MKEKSVSKVILSGVINYCVVLTSLGVDMAVIEEYNNRKDDPYGYNKELKAAYDLSDKQNVWLSQIKGSAVMEETVRDGLAKRPMGKEFFKITITDDMIKQSAQLRFDLKILSGKNSDLSACFYGAVDKHGDPGVTWGQIDLSPNMNPPRTAWLCVQYDGERLGPAVPYDLKWYISNPQNIQSTQESEAEQQFIQEIGQDVNIMLKNGMPPLMTAILNGYTKAVRIFIERGADVNGLNHYGKNTALMFAASRNIDNVKLLIEHGADVNAKDQDGVSVLMYAARSNKNAEIMKLLIASGADVNATSNWKGTVLMEAVFGNNVDAVKVLIEKGVDVNAVDNRPGGLTALKLASNSKRLEIIELLKAHGAIE